MAAPISLERGKVISAVDGVVDTWEWFIKKIKGIKGVDGISVEQTDNGIEIGLDDEEEEDEEDVFDDIPEIPELPIMDISGFFLVSGSDSTIVFTPITDTSDTNLGKTKIDIYYS